MLYIQQLNPNILFHEFRSESVHKKKPSKDKGKTNQWVLNIPEIKHINIDSN